MRRWQLDDKRPLALQLAADARLSETDYADDQSWQLTLGRGDHAALTLQTRYGGRAGMASIVPIFFHDGRDIYQAQAYHSAPLLTHFAPGFASITARLLPEISLAAQYWVGDSHSVYGRYLLENTGDEAVQLRLNLYAHLIQRSREQQISVMTLKDEHYALYLGKLANIDPVVMVDDGAAKLEPDGALRARVGRDLDIPPGQTAEVRWASAALPEVRNSLALIRYWLKQDWQPLLDSIESAAAAVPDIETGDPDTDAAIASAYHHLLQSALKPTEHLPHPSFVTTRQPLSGYSAAGDGSDYPREWSGQIPTTAYLVAAGTATVNPALAEGIVRNYLAVQAEDGSIDWAPGLGGQQRGQLAMPILARMAWRVYEQTQNRAFIADVFPGLARFFERWFREDTDTDADGLPEWQSLPQTGYAGWHLFANGIDITTTEGPDMAAYLLSEGDALQKMAALLGETDTAERLAARMDELQHTLNDLYRDGSFVYRDRDTHATPNGAVILDEGRADETHLPALALDEASRLVVEVVGGGSHKPRIGIELHGLDADGRPTVDTLDADAFVWGYGRGTATSRTVFSQIDKIVPSGLSRVYRISLRTVDLNERDINTMLPIIAPGLSDEQINTTVAELNAPALLLKPNGLAMFPTPTAPGADESGVWVFWNTLVIEGLMAYGYTAQAVDLLRRLLRVQAAVLREISGFAPFYHETDMRSMGDRFDLGGVVPVHLLMRAFGLRLMPDGTVHISDGFPWGESVIVRQHGLTVTRTAKQTVVTYPDGHTEMIGAGTAATVQPPAPVNTETAIVALPEKPAIIPSEPSRVPVQVEVEIDDEDES